MKTLLKILCSIIIIVNILMVMIGYIEVGGFRLLKIVSGSMEPTIKINDYIIIKKEKNYVVSDIVTRKENNNYITHQIVEIDSEYVTTKGTANNINDEKSLVNSIMGKEIIIFSDKIYLTIKIMGVLSICGLFLISGGKNEKEK